MDLKSQSESLLDLVRFKLLLVAGGCFLDVGQGDTNVKGQKTEK